MKAEAMRAEALHAAAMAGGPAAELRSRRVTAPLVGGSGGGDAQISLTIDVDVQVRVMPEKAKTTLWSLLLPLPSQSPHYQKLDSYPHPAL